MSFKLTWKSHVICFIISLTLFILMYPAIKSVLFYLLIVDKNFYSLDFLMLRIWIFSIVLMIPISIIHEAIHGAAFKLFGGKVKFGFKGIYAYTMEVSEVEIPRIKFHIVLLSPLVIISMLTMLLPFWLGCLVFILNLLGSSGDIYMAFFLCKFSYRAKIVDRRYGFDVVA